MIAYFTAVIYAYLYGLFAHRTPWIVRLLGLLPLVAFSAFRGSSGKDTPLYLLRWEQFNISPDNPIAISEPVFTLIVFLGRVMSESTPVPFFALHASLVLIGYAVVCSHWQESRVYLLTIGSVVVVDSITNGMRIGLAYHLLMVGILTHRFWSFSILAFLTHITAPFASAMSWLSDRVDPRIAAALLFSGVSWLVAFLATSPSLEALGLLGFSDRLDSKILFYLESPPGAWYSGLGDALVLCAILALDLRIQRDRIGWSLLQVVLIAVTFWAIFNGLQYSLGFIRIVKLGIIGLLIPYRQAPSLRRSYIVWLIGWVYILNFFRQVVTDVGFLPYGA